MRTRWSFVPLFVAAAVMALPVGAEEPVPASTCAVCHDQVVPEFLNGPHAAAMRRVDPKMVERACEGCHGPAAAHVEDPSAENIRRTPDASACRSCHQGRAEGMARSLPGHDRAGVTCLDCHVSGHTAPAASPLLRARAVEVCGRCHPDVRARFNLPFAHREGGDTPMACTNCHAVHGGGTTGRLLAGRPGGACVDCHSEKAGPFVFPHPPREVEGCVACHEPHGTPNPRQLRRSRVGALCLECHADVPGFHDLTQARFQTCQNCHVAVHGSQRDPTLLRE